MSIIRRRSKSWPSPFNNMADSLEKSEQQRKEFIANVSHELKTPMTTIAGFMDGMLDGTIPPEQHRHYMQISLGRSPPSVPVGSGGMLDISRLQDQTIPGGEKEPSSTSARPRGGASLL